MKIDIDTIFYIIISIIILALTGLTRRKKKITIPGQGSEDTQERVSQSQYEGRSSVAEDITNDPFKSLEKLFTQPEPFTTPEAVSLEELIDEEAEYLKEKEAAAKAKLPGREILKDDIKQQSSQIKYLDKTESAVKLKLFENIDELKKAVIYAEILNRKEF